MLETHTLRMIDALILSIQIIYNIQQEPVEPGDAARIGFGHRQEISSSQYNDHFCTIALKSDFK